MPVPDSYLEYANRHRGNEHGWFDFSPLPARPPVQWPGREKVALFVTVAFEHYPLSAKPGPVMAPTAVPGPAPNYIQYTLCDYGNRVGIFRLFEALDAHGFKATALFNSEAARLYPRLVEEVLSRGWEIATSGTDMSRIITGRTPIEEERALIRQSLSTLRAIAGSAIRGWHSPAFSQSGNTFPLLAEEGVEYLMDSSNNDMPNHIRVRRRVPRELAELWTNMCPAQVYEVGAEGEDGLVEVEVTPSNCVQCGAITAKGGRLTPPEGGSGPEYTVT